MRSIVLFILGLVTISCSHFSGLQVGQGERSNTNVSSCSHHVFAFPVEPETGKLDHLLVKYGIGPEHIYTLDESGWYWLFPIYYKYCNVAQLNKSGESVYLKSRVVETNKPEFADIKTSKDCDQFKTLKRDRCVEYLNKK